MQYRKFKGKDISLLGFGTMRLPVINGEKPNINESEAIEMIRYAIDSGVNYVDTAYMYHDGNSEIVTGKALKDGYREKVLLADKMPVWFADNKEDVAKIFDTQFERLDVDYIDNYLLHNLTAPIWKRCKEFEVLPFLEEKRAEGKIKNIGFSFHDELEIFKAIIDEYPWDFCQIQLNYMDADYQAGVKGLKYAAERNIPVIVMEPLKGGKLVDIIPDTVRDYWRSAEIQRTPAEWAFKWVADLPEVTCILSGMNSMEQVKENIRVASDGARLTKDELRIIEKAGEEYNRLIPYSCTNCRYCMPCPQKIDIPTVIGLRNDWELYGQSPKTKAEFDLWIHPKGIPSVCVKCGQCEEKCPQHLPVIKIMEESAELFENK